MKTNLLFLLLVMFSISISRSQNLSLDTTFGNGGLVTNWIGTDDNHCYAVALQTDKGIVIGTDTICETITLLPTLVSEISRFSQLVISPNPFSFETTIKFYQMEYGRSEISLFDLQGRKIKSIADRNFLVGTHQIGFSAGNLHKGTYLLKMQTANSYSTQKLILE